LEPYQKNSLRQQYPDTSILEPRDNLGKAVESRRAITLRFNERQEALDSTLPPGPKWVEAYQELRREQVGAFGQWEQQWPDEADRLRSQTPDNPNEAALSAYYDLFRAADEENWTPEEIDTRLGSLMSGFSHEQTAYIERNTGLHDTPVVREYRAAQEVLEPYYTIESQVWDRLNNRPGLSQYESVDAYLAAKAEELRQAGTPPELIQYRLNRLPVVRQWDSLVSQLRERLRLSNPAIDAELVKWYGAVPIRLQRRAG
jgi:hypothetical protein